MAVDNTDFTGNASPLVRELNKISAAFNFLERQQKKNELQAFRAAVASAQATIKQRQEIEKQVSEINKLIYAWSKFTDTQKEANAESFQASIAATAASKEATQQAVVQEKQVKQTRNAVHQLLLSWRSIVRLLSVQIVYRGVFALRQQLSQATKAATDLLIAVSEIQTIDTARGSFEEWVAVLKDLSNSFGFDILDEAEAAYQALSNQVVDSAADFAIFGEAVNRFSVATVTSATDSVKLLSGVIKAFGFDISESEKVAAKLFKTIELGRVRASELSDTFGRVSVLGAELGFSLEEVAALLTSITIRGVKANEALTQIRGLFVKLIKPTQETKKIFRELGVSSAEAAVQLFGGAEALKQIIGRAKDTTELGKIVNRIRGLTGALVLISDGFKSFDDAVNEITNDSLPDFDRAVQLTITNTGKQLRIALNEIRNFFVTDLLTKGLETLRVLTNDFKLLTASAVGFAAIIKAVLIPGIVAVTIQLVRMAAATKAAHLLFFRNPYFIAAQGVFILIAALTKAATATRDLEKSVQDQIRSAREQLEAIKEVRDKFLSDSIENIENLLNIAARTILQSAAKAQGAFAHVILKSISDFDQFGAEIDRINKEVIKSFRELAKETEKSLDKSIRAVEKQKEAIEDITSAFGDIATQKFEFSLVGKSDVEQIALLTQQISNLEAQRQAAATGGNLDAFEAINKQLRELFTRRQELVEKTREGAAESQKELDIELEKVKIARELARQKAIQNINDAQARQRENLRTGRQTPFQKADEQKKIDRLIDAARTKDIEFAEEILEIENKITEAKKIQGSVADRATAQAAVISNLEAEAVLRQQILADQQAKEQQLHQIRLRQIQAEADFEETLRKVKAFDLAKVLEDATNVAGPVENPVIKIINEQIDALRRLGDLRNELTGAAGPVIDPDISKQIENIRQATQARLAELELENARNIIDEERDASIALLEKEKDAADEITDKIDERILAFTTLITRLESSKFLEEIQERGGFRRQQGAKLAPPAIGGIDLLIKEAIKRLGTESLLDQTQTEALARTLPQLLEDLNNVENLSSQQLLSLRDQLSTLINTVKIGLPVLRKGEDPTTNQTIQLATFEDLNNALRALNNTIQSDKTFEDLRKEREQHEKNILSIEAELKVLTREQVLAAKVNKQSSDDLLIGAQSIADSMESFRQSVNNLASIMNRLGSDNNNRAFAAGITVRSLGSDTVPAMLSPGEEVINAASARKFRPLLKQINAQRFAHGGTVGTSIDVGGITVNESRTPQITAKAIVDEINRGTRQGTIRLN